MPKKILFSWLARPRPCCGPRKRWRDTVKKDLQAAGISTQLWYKEAQDRRQWHRKYSTRALNHQQSLRDKRRNGDKSVESTVCGRMFRREADKARHKCKEEREKPVCQQRGAIQCLVCERW